MNFVSSQISQNVPFLLNLVDPSLMQDWHNGPWYPTPQSEEFFPLFLISKITIKKAQFNVEYKFYKL